MILNDKLILGLSTDIPNENRRVKNIKKVITLIKDAEKSKCYLTKKLISALINAGGVDFDMYNTLLQQKFKENRSELTQRGTFKNQIKTSRYNNLKVDNLLELYPKNTNFRVIDVMTTIEYHNKIIALINLPIVFGNKELLEIRSMLDMDYWELFEIVKYSFNEGMKVKENIFKIISLFESSEQRTLIMESNTIKTTTDVLRYIYFVTDNDYTELPSKDIMEYPIKFKLRTSTKKDIMLLLSNISINEDDVLKYKKQWFRVQYNLSPYSEKFSKFSTELFDILKKNPKKTFSQKSENYKKKNKMKKLIKHLSKKPGELLRSLDYIIRNSKKKDIQVLKEHIEEINFSTKLLMQVRKWVEYRSSNSLETRTFKPKGKVFSTNEKPLDKLGSKGDVIEIALRNKLREYLKDAEDIFKDEI